MVYTAVIVAHAVLGTALLVVGFLALRAPKRSGGRHGRLGQAYFAILFTCLPLGLVIGSRHAGLSAFEVATPPTLALGLVGWIAMRRRPRPFLGQPWIVAHVSGMGGSYIGVVTAGAFQTFGRLAPDSVIAAVVIFAVPTLVGSPLIARAIAKRVPASPRVPGLPAR
ncbi:MAG: hypothetical protein QOI98_1271 [Solirubrobacteraceae bacterium]|nr:hypothetical protein [Solirubrobacteraceae bacterium]